MEAGQLGRLFGETCLAFPGNAAGLRDWLLAQGYQRVRPEAARAMLTQPGQIFDASTPAGHLLVLSFDSGWCGNAAQDVDPAAVIDSLHVAAAGAHLALHEAGDADGGLERRYRLDARAGGVQMRRLALLVRFHPDGAAMRSTLFLMPMDDSR